MIRLYGDTSYTLQLNECLRDDLIQRQKFQFMKVTQDHLKQSLFVLNVKFISQREALPNTKTQGLVSYGMFSLITTFSSSMSQKYGDSFL